MYYLYNTSIIDSSHTCRLYGITDIICAIAGKGKSTGKDKDEENREQ